MSDMHSPSTPPDPQDLLAFGRQMLERSLALVDAHAAADAPRYAGPVGSHMRHIIEHWDALVFPAEAGRVDYDARPRDRALETSPALARMRLLILRQQLAAWDADKLADPVLVRGLCGLAGEFPFSVASSLGRELVFVAVHAVHHFALLTDHCRQHGIALDADFDKAPATVASERASRAALRSLPTLHASQEFSCTPVRPTV